MRLYFSIKQHGAAHVWDGDDRPRLHGVSVRAFEDHLLLSNRFVQRCPSPPLYMYTRRHGYCSSYTMRTDVCFYVVDEYSVQKRLKVIMFRHRDIYWKPSFVRLKHID